MLADSNRSAFDVFATSQDDLLTGRLYHPDSGLQIFDQTVFTPQNEMIAGPLFNPAWPPMDNKIAWLTSAGERFAVQVYDWETQTAVQIHDWDPARFGATIPSPVWSPDGQWLVLEIWANGTEGSGIWLLAADGSSQTLIDASGHNPYWVSVSQFVYAVNGETRLVELPGGETARVDLPTGSWVFGVTPLSDLLALPDMNNEEETAVATPDSSIPTDPTDIPIASELTVASPDGRWQATALQTEPIIVGDLEKLYVSLVVSDGTTTWTPVAEWRGYGLGYIWPTPFQWSADGRYLYYTNAGSGDGCLYYSNGSDLHRLDVTDGTVVEILPDGKTGNLSLSPDESTLAYTHYNGNAVSFVVQDLATGVEQSVVISELGEYAQTGQIFWSADGQTAVLSLTYNACNPDETSSIVRINLAEMSATTLIAKDVRRFFISEWPDPTQPEIRLIDKDGNFWWLDVNSGELAQEE
ncbi:MAG: hypothetical protein HC804_06030 [Anaerolineae bacterium]|nr:hypothetical protein [Anaerolineae bacterium]